MSVQQLINRACTIIRHVEGEETDDYGNNIPVEISVTTVCELQQRSRDEQDDQGELSDTLWDLFFLPGETVHTGDVVRVDDDEYEIFGRPWRARNPRTQEVTHIEATARQTVGALEEGS